jgi:hypothetical protein
LFWDIEQGGKCDILAARLWLKKVPLLTGCRTAVKSPRLQWALWRSAGACNGWPEPLLLLALWPTTHRYRKVFEKLVGIKKDKCGYLSFFN